MRNATKPTRKRPAGAKTRRKKISQPATMELMGVVTWMDPMRKPEGFVIGNAPYDPASERALLQLEIDLRVVASVEIRPARRPLTDKEGVVADALRLANTPL